MTTVADAAAWLERSFPPSLAEEWDAVGLAVGDPSAPVSLVHFAVDPTLAVITEAIDAGADLLVTHHPLLLHGVTSLAANTLKGAAVHALSAHSLALFTAHTNADAARGGVADSLAAALGLEVTGPLVPHPTDGSVGTGRVGVVAGGTTLRALAARVAEVLPATAYGVLVAGDLDGRVERVAVVGGSGGDFIETAAAASIDAYITADLRHHRVSEAREAANLGNGRPYLIGVSHAASESLWLDAAAEGLQAATGVSVYVSTLNTDPWTERLGANHP